MSTKRRSVMVLMIALLILVTTVGAMAQSSLQQIHEKELTGVVTAITPTTITIGGMTFDIAQAEMKDTIVLGDLVTVHYSPATDGTLVVREVQLFAITPEATEAFDDHGQDNPTHIEDQHQGHDDNGRGSGSGRSASPTQAATHTGDEHGHDNSNTPQRQSTPQSPQQDHGGHHNDSAGHGG